MNTIEIVKEDQKTTFIELPKVGGKVDVLALQKLLDRKAPEKPLEILTVRCNRQAGKWCKCEPTSARVIENIDVIVMKDVTFDTIETISGCSISTGMATGSKIADGSPVSVPSHLVRKLVFHAESFRDAETGQEVKACDYLILREQCQHNYIPKGGAKKK